LIAVTVNDVTVARLLVEQTCCCMKFCCNASILIFVHEEKRSYFSTMESDRA